MGVDLGGGEAFVTQHFLHGTEVGTVLHQFGGEAVAEAVWRHILVQAGLVDSLLDELEDRHAGEVVATEVEEDVLFLAGLGSELAAGGVDIVLQKVQRMGVDGHPALFIAFADDLQHFLFGVDVGETEIDQLGDPKATTVEHFDDDIVAVLPWKATVEGVLYGGDILVSEHVGQMLWTVGHVDQFGRIL